tara:strand:- start:1306 stop:1617 length:312 start_codon:yes stop_codon:yes gene_type:complete
LTWSRVEELGLGLLGLTPGLLYSLTFEEFANAVKGRRESIEVMERSNWERTRWQTALLLNVHTKKGSKIRPIDLCIFPWEEEVQSAKPQIDGFGLLRAMSKKE